MFYLGLVLGLIVGWNLPQPQFVADLVEKVKNYFKQ